MPAFGGTFRGGADISGGVVPDNEIFAWGDDSDLVSVLNTAGLSANEQNSDLFTGTAVYGTAINGNSWIVSNRASGGDIVFFATTDSGGTNSREVLRISASGGTSSASTVTITSANRNNVFRITDGTTVYYQVDTRTGVAGQGAHVFDRANLTVAAAATRDSALIYMNDWILNLTGATQVTGLMSNLEIQPFTVAGAVAVTVDKATGMWITAPTEGSNVTLTDASAIRIGGGGGSPTNQHGILIETLTGGGTDYMLTLGSTDADHNLIHVGVSGDPILSWDESEDRFLFSHGVNVGAASLILDNILFSLGTSGDIGMVLNSAGLATDTELTGVIVGTSVYPNAIPANSFIMGNITADGDLVFFGQTGGNSTEAFRVDSSASQVVLNMTLANATGDLTINPVASLNVTLTAGDADAYTANDGTTDYYNIDTRLDTSGVHVHSWDTSNPSIVNIPTANFTMARTIGYTLIITTDADDITGPFPTQLHLERTTITSDFATTNFTGIISSLRIRGPAAGNRVVLDNMAEIHIEDGGGQAGSETIQHGIFFDTLTVGTANYYLTIGNTDVDHNIIHVGVSGDPIFSWDESEDRFNFSHGVNYAGTIGTLSGDLTINPAASLNVVLTVDDADAFDLSNDNSVYYLVNTANTAVGTVVHTFDSEDATLASASGAIYTLVSTNAFTLNYTGTTSITSLQSTVTFLATSLVGASAVTVNKATNLQIVAPAEGSNVTLTDASAIRILDAGGTPTNQHGILIETLTVGVTADYMLTLGSSDADHNLIHVGVTGDPVLLWDESQDQFSLNKGLDITAGTITHNEVNDGTAGATDTIDWGTGNYHLSTLDENVTYTFTAPEGPAGLTLRIVQDGAGTNTVTWPSTVKWPAGTPPVVSAGASEVTIVGFYFDGTNYHANFSLDSS